LTATDAQVRIMMQEREKGRTQEQAAASANVSSRKTVAKYERLGRLPSEVSQPPRYRTRADPFAEDWPTAETMLESKALFEWLCEQHPERYQPGQVRTFQRRLDDCGGHVSHLRADGRRRRKVLGLQSLRPAGRRYDGGQAHTSRCVRPWEWGSFYCGGFGSQLRADERRRSQVLGRKRVGAIGNWYDWPE